MQHMRRQKGLFTAAPRPLDRTWQLGRCRRNVRKPDRVFAPGRAPPHRNGLGPNLAHRAFDEHERLLKSGLSVPQNLDPLHERALKRLYELQADLDPQSPDLKEIRDISAAIIAHYAKPLEYDDVARDAIAVKAEKSVPAADEFAAFQMACLHPGLADRQFSRLVQQYGTAR